MIHNFYLTGCSFVDKFLVLGINFKIYLSSLPHEIGEAAISRGARFINSLRFV